MEKHFTSSLIDVDRLIDFESDLTPSEKEIFYYVKLIEIYASLLSQSTKLILIRK